MAPPQVDLNKKQPLEDVQNWAQTVGDQKLPTVHAVSVEEGTKVGGKRCCGQRRCKKLIIGMIIGAVVAVAITVTIFVVHRQMLGQHWRSHVKDDDGHEAEEDVRTDGSRRLIHVARNETYHFFRLMAVLDYGTQMAGFKDFGKQRCYLDRLRESYEDGCERWRRYRQHSRRPTLRPLRVVTPAVDPNVLRNVAGEDISALCGNIPTYWVLETTPDTPHDSTTDIIYL